MRSLLAAALFLWCGGSAALAGPAGSVVGVSGDCIVEHAGNRSGVALGGAVEVGDTVEVPADGKLKLRMEDGSIVSVAAGTRMTIAAYAVTDKGQRQNATLSLTQGLLHSVVAPVNPPATFEVQTAVGTAAVRSTDWYIEATPTDEQVTVVSGSVAVTSAATKNSVVVPAGRGTRVERGHDPLPPRALSRAEFGRLRGRTEIRPHPREAPRYNEWRRHEERRFERFRRFHPQYHREHHHDWRWH